MKKRGQRPGGRGQKNGQIALSQHPRAQRQIGLAKGWAGLAGAAFSGYVAWKSGLPYFDTVLRALMWGVACYVVVWFLAVQVWRQVAIAEVRAAEKQWLERKHEADRLARERAAQMQAEMASQP